MAIITTIKAATIVADTMIKEETSTKKIIVRDTTIIINRAKRSARYIAKKTTNLQSI